MNKHKRIAVNLAKDKAIDHARLMEIIPNAFSPRLEKARLLKAIATVLETKSTPELAAILNTLKGISDKKIKYPQIKRAQNQFSKLLEQSEIQN